VAEGVQRMAEQQFDLSAVAGTAAAATTATAADTTAAAAADTTATELSPRRSVAAALPFFTKLLLESLPLALELQDADSFEYFTVLSKLLQLPKLSKPDL
jgi:hypothetical protein